MTLSKTLFFVIFLFLSINTQAAELSILNGDEDGDIAIVRMQGNKHSCNVSINSIGQLLNTNCQQLANENNEIIICTHENDICKTINEIRSFVSAPMTQDDVGGFTETLDKNQKDGITILIALVVAIIIISTIFFIIKNLF